MSLCTVCHIDSKKHSKKLWDLHKQIRKCMFCRKTSDAHSEELWQMHNSVVEKALRGTRHKKLWTMQIGSGRDCPAVLDTDYRQDNHNNPSEWLIPIYMSCTECGLYLGNLEEDCADILSEMCLKCFMGATSQKEVNMDDFGVVAGKFADEKAELKKKATAKGRIQAEQDMKNLIKNSLIPTYQQMPYDPRDITVLSHPVDFVVFDGANKVRMKEQDFVKEVLLLTKKTNNAYSQKLHKSIHDVIQNKEYEWKTAKVLDGNIEFK